MVTTERNRNGSWVVTALVRNENSWGPFYRSVVYYDYTEEEAIAAYLMEYENEIIKEEED